MGEPVPEQRFTHSHLSWSKTILNQLLQPTMIQFTCLTVFLHNLSPGPLGLASSTSYSIHYFNQCLLFVTHPHTIATCFSVVPRLHRLIFWYLLIRLVPESHKTVVCLCVCVCVCVHACVYACEHACMHVCVCDCILSVSSLLSTRSFILTPHIRLTILISARWSASSSSFLTGQVFHITYYFSHNCCKSAVWFPSHFQWCIHIGKQCCQVHEFVLSSLNSGLHSCISISMHALLVTLIAKFIH